MSFVNDILCLLLTISGNLLYFCRLKLLNPLMTRKEHNGNTHFLEIPMIQTLLGLYSCLAELLGNFDHSFLFLGVSLGFLPFCGFITFNTIF